MKYLLIIVSILCIGVVTNQQAFAQELVVEKIKPLYKKCDNIPETKQTVRYETTSNGGASIRWIWREKPDGNCFWALSLPKDISSYIDGFLIINYDTESNNGSNSPEVTIIDGNDNRTPNLKLYGGKYKYASDKQFKIPITDFGVDNINLKNVRQLQFDSPYDHSEGNIVIKSVRFVR